jgi:CBS domain-containing protein
MAAAHASPRLFLRASSAQEVMSGNPLSLDAHATVLEAAALFLDKGISAAAVINEAGHPIGMLSRTDLIRYQRENAGTLTAADRQRLQDAVELSRGDLIGPGFQVMSGDGTPVSQLMTPTVFKVIPEMPIELVIKEMLHHKVHHLCVVDRFNVLVGMISPLDILKQLIS